MTQQTLLRDGPKMFARIGYDRIDDRRFCALIDTGSEHTVIDSGIAKELALPEAGNIVRHGVDGLVPMKLCRARVIVDSSDFVFDSVCATTELAGPGKPDILLGRSWLAHFLLIYDGRTGQVYVSHKAAAVTGPPIISSRSADNLDRRPARQ